MTKKDLGFVAQDSRQNTLRDSTCYCCGGSIQTYKICDISVCVSCFDRGADINDMAHYFKTPMLALKNLSSLDKKIIEWWSKK